MVLLGRIGQIAAVTTAGVLMVTAGCGSSGSDDPGRAGPVETSHAPTVNGSPFTGEPTDLSQPVLVVKIDNFPDARPQTGVAEADLVYVEPVEYGLTRLIAVYHSEVPAVAGPVRSARETDLDLLVSFGRPVLAYSGAAPEITKLVTASGIEDASAVTVPGAYFNAPDRRVPHNTFVRTDELPAGSPPRDIGFRFGPVPAESTPVASTTVRYPATEPGFESRPTVTDLEWRPAQRDWVFTMDGEPLIDADGTRVSAATVVVQKVRIRQSTIRDSSGAVSPIADTVGSGEVTVLRDGAQLAGTWNRAAPDAPTEFVDGAGTPIPFARGAVWVFLVPR